MALEISDKAKISIITPFFNAFPFLEDCITSIINQSYDNWELILVNDQSSDDSNLIASKYANLDQRIQLYQNEDKGLISSLRLAYEKCSGNFITRMDADDIMPSDKLRLLHHKLKQCGEGHVCIGKVKYFSENGLGEGYKQYETWLNDLTEQVANFSEIYRECSIPSPNFLIHRTDFESIGGFEHDTYPEDYDLALRMYQNDLKVCSVNKVTHYWRDHSNRSTRTQAHYQPISFIPLKVKYFLQIDNKKNKELILWGAGKKGKLIAKELINNNVAFNWVTENENKIGKDIYDQTLVNPSLINFTDAQVIVAVSNPDEVLTIENHLSHQKDCKFWRFF